MPEASVPPLKNSEYGTLGQTAAADVLAKPAFTAPEHAVTGT